MFDVKRENVRKEPVKIGRKLYGAPLKGVVDDSDRAARIFESLHLFKKTKINSQLRIVSINEDNCTDQEKNNSSNSKFKQKCNIENAKHVQVLVRYHGSKFEKMYFSSKESKSTPIESKKSDIVYPLNTDANNHPYHINYKPLKIRKKENKTEKLNRDFLNSIFNEPSNDFSEFICNKKDKINRNF